MPLLKQLFATLAPHGLNLVGATPIDAYDAGVPAEYALATLLPEARTAIVIGNGGRALWDAFAAFTRTDPEAAAGPDPLDDFTQRTIERVVTPVLSGRSARILYPFRFPAEPVSFMRLAECAGLGHPSLVGVLVHPVFGPWIALRAAILLTEPVDAPRPSAGFDPCPTCRERACIAACPAGAVSAAGWDIPTCARHRLAADDECASRCHARFDCVIGREHRYPPEELAFHQRQARPRLVSDPRR
jgi:hypothetical protein